MSLSANNIREGTVYVNDFGDKARIIDLIFDSQVYYRNFWLIDGEYLGEGICELVTIMRWIGRRGREATAEEIKKLDYEHSNPAYQRMLQAARRLRDQ